MRYTKYRCKKVDAVPVLIGCRQQDGSTFINDNLKAMYAKDATQNMCGPSGCSNCTLIEKDCSEVYDLGCVVYDDITGTKIPDLLGFYTCLVATPSVSVKVRQ